MSHQPLRYLSPIHRATRAITRILDEPCRELGIAGEEGHLVAYLSPYGPCPVGRLREVFGVKGSTLTHRLDRLERMGLLERTPNPEDRRSTLVGLTPAGHRAATRLRGATAALENAIDDRITAEQFAGFRAVLTTIDELETNDPLQET